MTKIFYLLINLSIIFGFNIIPKTSKSIDLKISKIQDQNSLIKTNSLKDVENLYIYSEIQKILNQKDNYCSLTTINNNNYPYTSATNIYIDNGQPLISISEKSIHHLNINDNNCISVCIFDENKLGNRNSRITFQGNLKFLKPGNHKDRLFKRLENSHRNFWNHLNDFDIYKLNITNIYFMGGYGASKIIDIQEYQHLYTKNKDHKLSLKYNIENKTALTSLKRKYQMGLDIFIDYFTTSYNYTESEIYNFLYTSERKHGQISMASFVGIISGELFNGPFLLENGCSPTLFNGGLQQIDNILWAPILILPILHEIIFKGFLPKKNEVIILKNDKLYDFELVNGRLAMIGIVLVLFYEYFSHHGIVNSSVQEYVTIILAYLKFRNSVYPQ